MFRGHGRWGDLQLHPGSAAAAGLLLLITLVLCVDLLQGQLRLPVGELAGGESVVTVKADVEAGGLEL